MRQRNLVLSLCISLLLAVILSSLFVTGLFSNIQAKLFDKLYGGKQPLNNIILIGIDDKSLQDIGRWPWPRERFIELLDNIREPAVIGLDISFYEAYNPEIDYKLANKLKEFNSVLAAEYSFGSNTDVLLPAAPYMINEIGFSNIYTDKDGITRSVPFTVDNRLKSFPAEIYRLYAGKELTFDNERILIDFINEPGSFKSYSFSDVINEKIKPSVFNDAIVLVGATSPGLHDSYFVPTSNGKAMPGIEVHANALQTMLTSAFLYKQPATSVILLIFISAVMLWVISHRFNMAITLAAIMMALFIYFLAVIYFFDRHIIMNVIYVPLSIIFTPVANLALFYTLEKRHKKQIVEAFGRYVSPLLVKEIAEHPDQVSLGGEKRNLTIMFTDIRGFTTLSESLTPEKLVHLLNEYLSEMTQIILDNKGTVDKFIGDAIMAFWGAPVKEQNHEMLACKSAMLMLEKLDELREKWKSHGHPMIDIGIGINTGEVIIGNMGSMQRFDYTAMGDPVNLASRLEGINKQYGTRIVISEFTYEKIRHHFTARKLDIVRVKGKNKPIMIYEIIVGADSKTKEIISLFEQGLSFYQKKRFDDAAIKFNKILEIKDDKAAGLFIERCSHFKKHPPPPDWDGVSTMTSK